MEKEKEEKIKKFFEKSQKDPAYFIRKVWWLSVTSKKEEFVKGSTLTHQQSEIVEAVKKAVNWEAPRQITIRSWHGIGKSTIVAMLIIWYLFCHKNSQIPTTAPTAPQLQDILRKEVSTRLNKMPEPIKEQFDLTSDYLRIKSNREWRFARARTGKKENPEALAGVHSDYVMLLADEASWVADEVFNSSSWALSWPNKLFILISNPTRLTWYFYKTQKQLEWWQRLNFSSKDSPIVDHSFVDKIITEHGEDSDEYRIRVLWEFPKEEWVDSKGFLPLINMNKVEYVWDLDFSTNARLGVDCWWQWSDETILVLRDSFWAKILAREKISTPKTIASLIVESINSYGLLPSNVSVDNIGVGANVSQEVLRASGYVIHWVNVGEKAISHERFVNSRAEAFWSMRDRIIAWGQLTWDNIIREDLAMLRYRRELNGKIKLMSKHDMRKLFGKSPDVADALMLTFIAWDVINTYDEPIEFSMINPDLL